MYLPGMVGLLVLGFMLGRAWQKHSDGLWDYEQEVYEEGYVEGLKVGREDGWAAGMRQQGWRRRC